MEIKNTYPSVKGKKFSRRRLLNVLRWPFIFSGITCLIVNLAVGGVAWSPIALLGMIMIWKLILSPDLVEYNRTSQTIKIVVYTLILLTLVDVLLIPGWAVFVVPIVCFAGLALCGILFFTDLETQKHNMMPLILFVFFAIIGSVVGLSIWHEHDYWPFIVLGGVSIVLLLLFIFVLGQDFLRELKRRFHVK